MLSSMLKSKHKEDKDLATCITNYKIFTWSNLEFEFQVINLFVPGISGGNFISMIFM